MASSMVLVGTEDPSRAAAVGARLGNFSYLFSMDTMYERRSARSAVALYTPSCGSARSLNACKTQQHGLNAQKIRAIFNAVRTLKASDAQYCRLGPYGCKRTHHKDKGHEAAEDCEEDVAPFIAEAAPSLKKDEGGHKECANGVQESPVHRR